MARNDQVTRQWHLLRRLEGSVGLTLEELGEGLPEDSRRHLRTVRRDLEALESVGFPMVTERVAGQTRWKLMDGFRRVPALGFAPSELMAWCSAGTCSARSRAPTSTRPWTPR